MAKRTLPLSKIRLDGNTQPRVELDEGLISEYQEAYQSKAEMPLLEVMFDGASYWLWDGFHRRWAADRAGLEKVACNVTNGTQQDAQWASYGTNITHGMRRTNADKQKAVKAALRHPNGPKMSDRKIAEHCGVHFNTVAKFRAELSGEGTITTCDSRTGRDGRTTNTANIGKARKQRSESREQADESPSEAAAGEGQDTAPQDADEHEPAAAPPQDRIVWVIEELDRVWNDYVGTFGDRAERYTFVAGLENWKVRSE